MSYMLLSFLVASSAMPGSRGVFGQLYFNNKSGIYGVTSDIKVFFFFNLFFPPLTSKLGFYRSAP